MADHSNSIDNPNRTSTNTTANLTKNSKCSTTAENEPNNRIVHQIELLFRLKKQVDLIYKRLNLQTVCLRRFSRFHKFMKTKILLTTTDTIDKDIRVEYAKFYQNYRYWRKLSKNLDKHRRQSNSSFHSFKSSKFSDSSSASMSAANVYEILYDLHENLTFLDDETINRAHNEECDGDEDEGFDRSDSTSDQTLLRNNQNSITRPITENDVVVELSEPNESSDYYLPSATIDNDITDEMMANFEQSMTTEEDNQNNEDDDEDLNYSPAIESQNSHATLDQQQQQSHRHRSKTQNGGQYETPLAHYEAEFLSPSNATNNQPMKNSIKIKRVYRSDHHSSSPSPSSKKKKRSSYNLSYSSSSIISAPAPNNQNSIDDSIFASPTTTGTIANPNNNNSSKSVEIKMEPFDNDSIDNSDESRPNRQLQQQQHPRRSGPGVRVHPVDNRLINNKDQQNSATKKSQIVTYPCPVKGCQFKGKSPSYLRYHQRVHVNERPFKCEKCNKSYKDFYSLNAHQKVHLVRYCCTFDNCNANYSAEQTLRNHIAIVHTKKAPVLFCPWPNCDYSSQYKNNFERHCSLHTGNRPYPCPKPDCDSSYSEKKFLLKHLKKDHNLDDTITTAMISRANFRSYSGAASSSSAQFNLKRDLVE